MDRGRASRSPGPLRHSRHAAGPGLRRPGPHGCRSARGTDRRSEPHCRATAVAQGRGGPRCSGNAARRLHLCATRSDVRVRASSGSHFSPHAMRSRAKARIDEGKLPQLFKLETVEIEAAIVDVRIRLDGHTAVVASVAHGNLERPHFTDDAFMPDLRGEGPHAPECAARRNRVAEPTLPLLEVARQLPRHLDAEADARHVDEGVPVDLAEVDGAGLALDHDLCGPFHVEGSAECTSQVVGSAQRQNAERTPVSMSAGAPSSSFRRHHPVRLCRRPRLIGK